MMLGHLRLQVVPLTSGACSLDHCRISEPAEEPLFYGKKVFEAMMKS